MTLTEQDKEEIRQIIDQQLEAFLKYCLRAFQPPTATPPKQSTLQPPARVGFDINQLPTELRQHLTYKEGKIYSEYTSREKWTQINQALKDLGYEWISDGKNSHWSLKQ